MMKVVAVSLLVLLALAGLPFAMDGGAMMPCPSCPSGHASTTFTICLAVLAIVVAFSLVMSGRATVLVSRDSRTAVAVRLLKPPRAL